MSQQDASADEGLRGQLSRWVAAGLIDAGQASRIEAAERAAAEQTAAERAAAERPAVAGGHSGHAQRRLPLVVEVLGYVGGAVALTAGLVVVNRYWRNVPAAAELALAATTGIVLAVAGAALRPAGEPALTRLRGVLWLLSTACAAWFANVLAHRTGHLSGGSVALVTTLAWLACAAAFWWRNRTWLQHLALFGGAVGVAEASIHLAAPDAEAWAFGIGLWALSLLWGAAAWRSYLRPRTAGLVVACAGLLVGATLTMDTAAGQALAVATVAGLLAVGVAARQVLVLGFGGAGTIWVVPRVADRYLPGSAAAPLAVAVVGLSLLGIALWLARTHGRAGRPPAGH